MISRQFRAFIAASTSIALFSFTGCQICRDKVGFKRCKCESEQAASPCDEAGCPISPNGNVNTKEKDPKKARRDAKKDAKINADGCSPECERIPLLKRIADEDNLKSDIEVIKTAAKIKHEEEMCQQKVKAVKYLGTIGCKCYDKDGEVKKALVAALNDCLPAVRMAAVQAVGGCVCGQPYGPSCCNEEIANRIHEMAFGTNTDGSYVEPDQNIRQWAAYVSQFCPKEGAKPSGGDKLKEGSGNAPTPITPPELINDKSANSSAKPEPYDQSSVEQIVDNKVAATWLPAENAKDFVESQWTRTYILTQSRSGNAMVANAVWNSATTIEVLEYDAERMSAAVFAKSQRSANGSKELALKAAANKLASSNNVNQVASTSALKGNGKVSLSAFGSDDSDFFPEDNAAKKLVKAEPDKGFDDFDPFSDAARPVAKASDLKAARDLTNMVALADETPRVFSSQPVAVESVAVAPVEQEIPNRLPVEPEPVVPSVAHTHVPGIVQSVELTSETAMIRLQKNTMVSEGSRVHVVHRYALGRLQSVGEFEVLRCDGAFAQVRPVAGTSLRMIAVGDAANIY